MRKKELLLTANVVFMIVMLLLLINSFFVLKSPLLSVFLVLLLSICVYSLIVSITNTQQSVKKYAAPEYNDFWTSSAENLYLVVKNGTADSEPLIAALKRNPVMAAGVVATASVLYPNMAEDFKKIFEE